MYGGVWGSESRGATSTQNGPATKDNPEKTGFQTRNGGALRQTEGARAQVGAGRGMRAAARPPGESSPLRRQTSPEGMEARTYRSALPACRSAVTQSTAHCGHGQEEESERNATYRSAPVARLLCDRMDSVALRREEHTGQTHCRIPAPMDCHTFHKQVQVVTRL